MKSSKVNFLPISDLITVVDKKNIDGCDYPVIGINREKEFMPTVATLDGIDIRKYKIVRKGYFVFSGMQTGRDMCIRIGLYDSEETAVISPAYTTFEVTNPCVTPEYFFIYFKRDEMDRYGAFLSDSSVRSNLDWERFLQIEIPIIPMEEQKAISELYRNVRESKKLAEKIQVEFGKIWSSILMKHI